MKYLGIVLLFILCASSAQAVNCPSSQHVGDLPQSATSGQACLVVDAAGCDLNQLVLPGGNTTCMAAWSAVQQHWLAASAGGWNGSDATALGPNGTLNNFSLNGALSPRSPQFKASGSSQSTTGTIAAGSTTLTLAAKIDFANGQGISISQAGPANTAAAPTGTSAALPNYPATTFVPVPYNATGSGHQYLIQPTTNNAGNNIYEITAVSSSTTQGITSGTQPNWGTTCSTANSSCTDGGLTWTQHSASYTTTYTYKLAAIDSNFGISAATAGFTCTAASTLSELSPCVVKWTAGANDIGVLVYRNNALIAIVPSSDTSFNDEGFISPSPSLVYWPDFPTTPPASAVPGRLITSIVSGGGSTTLTLAASATSAVTAQAVNHDDTVAMQAWINALLAINGSWGICPQGIYQVSSQLNFVPATGAIGTYLVGEDAPNQGPAGCLITYNGDPNKAVLYANNARFSHFDQVSINSNAMALYGLQIDNSDGSHASASDIYTKMMVFAPSPSINAAGIEFGHPGMGAWQVSEMLVKESFIYYYQGGPPNLANVGIRTVQANGNLKNYHFIEDIISGSGYGYDLGGNGATLISGGVIANSTVTDIYDRGSDQLTVVGLEDENDKLTGGKFVNAAVNQASRSIQLHGNSWESATQTDDTVITVGGAALISNTFFNLRTSSSVAAVEADVQGGTPGSNNSGIISFYNDYENVLTPWLPPIYDKSNNQVVDFVNAFPFGTAGTAVPVMSFGDKTRTSASGNAINLKNVNGFGGDQVLTRVFAVGKTGVPIIDANAGSPLIKNFNTALSTQGVGTVPNTIANLATCNAGNEGLIARQTNSTAACSSGATATTAGTTHCFVGCNGANWIQFGF